MECGIAGEESCGVECGTSGMETSVVECGTAGEESCAMECGICGVGPLLRRAVAWRSPKAVVSITPDTHVFTGEIVTLRCEKQGGGDTQWTYKFNKSKKELSNEEGRFYADSASQVFRIQHVEDSDSGTYTCRGKGRDSQSSEISDAVTLTVSAKPKPTVRVNPQSSVYTGDTITLSCELQQGTGWEFQWYKNDQSLQNLNREQVKTLNATVDNAGETEYKCRTGRRNYYNYHNNYYYYYTEFSDSVRITVRVRPKPVATINPDNQVFSGETVTLRCDIQDESVSSWQYSWYKDASHSPVSSGQVYRISGVEVTHTGKYTCRGAERGGSRSSHSSDAVTLTVSAKPKATVRVNPQSSVYTGDTVTLSCELQQETGWGFQWYKNNQLLQNLNSKQENTLKVTVDNAGETEYKCKGFRRNYYTQFSDSVKITVRARPKPVATVDPDNQVLSGETVTLRCDIQDESVSSWQYSWYKDASHSPVSSGQVYRISGVEVTHTGKYTCRGAERGGSRSSHSSDAVTLTARPKPVASIDPDNQVFSGETVTLRCDIQDESVSSWQYSWYKDASHSPVSSGQVYRISGVEVTHTGVEAPFSVLMLICSVVTVSPYLLVTIILLLICYRARAHTDEDRIENAAIEE
ncbi:carcinoembryonic antigen-related cell adhesion molecule 5-like [Hemibagrus wyckioides]|uniref:carcinoembryonic antigen-related cell adhesion molecule 5-like n=1 Tax=Hemibagrus wyckioides TaxID=337641 RepID=UPI00266B4038|nr:carcinoembryonic antigen-related cell adhesion molecule 5-like [Hemibagrus wyckioides]